MKKITKDDFLKKYRISEGDFNKTNLKWTDLSKIYEEHQKNYNRLNIISNFIFETLTELTTVHSIRKRIKDPEHLIEKIIRKTIDKPEIKINSSNYNEIITDLIGVRVLHLFKEDWLYIHNKIINTWKTVEKPTANIRRGDIEEVYIQNGCCIKEHKYGYRSVHYLIEFPCTKDSSSIVEIQVRTLFEEAWSEIDHTVRYPYDIDNPILAGYLVVFNSLAGSADQMGSFIKILKQELDMRNNEILEKDKLIKELKEEINKSQLNKQDKDKITESLNRINYLKYDTSNITKALSSSLLSASTLKIDTSILKSIGELSKSMKIYQNLYTKPLYPNMPKKEDIVFECDNTNKINEEIEVKEQNEDKFYEE